MNKLKSYIFKCIPAILLVGMFFSCENDLENVRVVTATSETPDRIITDLHTYYSDSGIVRYEIIATKMEDYSTGELRQIFRDGFKVNYYADSANLVSQLSAEYAEIRKSKNLIIAKNNVIFTNFEKEQTLKTEELFWDQRIRKIRTTKNFFVESPNTTAKGVGLVADETFSTYEMDNFSLIYKDTTK